MDHWREAFGPDLIEVQYEDLATDPDPTIHALLERCGLQPEPPCFRPHEQGGVVTTLSQGAVRQPINRDAIETWKTYSDQLTVLRDALPARDGRLMARVARVTILWHFGRPNTRSRAWWNW